MFTFNVLLFIIFFIIYLGNWTHHEYSLLLIMLSGGILLHLLVLGIAWSAGGLAILKIMLGLYTLGFLLFVGTSEFYFKARIKYVWTLMAVFSAIIILSIIITPTTRSFVRYSGALYVAFNIIYHIYVPALLFMTIIRDPIRYWYLSIVSIFTMIMDIYYLYCLISMRLFNLPFHISQVPILLLLILIIFVSEYNEMRKENSSIAKNLLVKTRELQKLHKLYNSSAKGKFREEPREAINDVIEYLDGNYYELYDRQDLAERFKIKEDYMCQVFKKKTGTSISNYINTLRIEAAKKLLEDTDSRVIDIAFHVGFENLTHFHRLFKKMTGTTPNSYRDTVHTPNAASGIPLI
jgi:AraC-like DNA-binding protein